MSYDSSPRSTTMKNGDRRDSFEAEELQEISVIFDSVSSVLGEFAITVMIDEEVVQLTFDCLPVVVCPAQAENCR